jgi:hypothetical protein
MYKAKLIKFLIIMLAFSIIETSQSAVFAEDIWQKIGKIGPLNTFRTKVPGGWVVRTVESSSTAMVFVPDAGHAWVPVPEGVTPFQPWYFGRFLRVGLKPQPGDKQCTMQRIGTPDPPDEIKNCAYINVDNIIYVRELVQNYNDPTKERSEIVTTGGSIQVMQAAGDVMKLIYERY